MQQLPCHPLVLGFLSPVPLPTTDHSVRDSAAPGRICIQLAVNPSGKIDLGRVEDK